MKTLPMAGLLLLTLTACSGPSNDSASNAAADPAASTGPAASTDPDLAARSPADARTDSPARLDGYGGAALGAVVSEVRKGYADVLHGLGTDAAGNPLPADDSNEGCYYLQPQGAESPRFMIESRKLVRYEVSSPSVLAPGGGKVGMTLGELQVLYPERADVGPDKYDDKVQHLRVRPQQEGQAIIDFTVAGDGKVSQWRVGMPPQVDYVEGCG